MAADSDDKIFDSQNIKPNIRQNSNVQITKLLF